MCIHQHSRIYFVRLLSPTLGHVIQIPERSECAKENLACREQGLHFISLGGFITEMTIV